MKKLLLTDEDFEALLACLRRYGEVHRRLTQNDALNEQQRLSEWEQYQKLQKLHNLLNSQR